jgi:FAD/FMN-containing dehydrogenase
MPVSSSRSLDPLIAQLRRKLNGRVLTPEDSGYDDSRRVFYGGVDRRPAAIVYVADEGDVNGVELAVRSGGHSLAGHCVTDGGIVIDLRQMKALSIEVNGRTATAQTGLTAGELTAAAGAHGLAIGFGDTGSVGIGGITLGGGVGYFVRKHGPTIDSLLGADIVTADPAGIGREHAGGANPRARGSDGEGAGEATAFAHRASRMMVNVAAFYNGPEDRAVREGWVLEFAASLRQNDSGAYVGFLGNEGEDRVRAAYPESTWDRLAAIKARYDPTNLFRLNQNVPPAVASRTRKVTAS